MKRSLEKKLSELQSSLAKHNREATERKFAIQYHKVVAWTAYGMTEILAFEKHVLCKRCY